MKTQFYRLLVAPRIVIGCIFLMCAALANAFPDRPVTIVVPATPGSSSDLVARLMVPKLTQLWGQPVIVENRTGAGTLVGTQYVLKQKPDGHTLLLAFVELATMPSLNKKIQIDVLNGLDPIGRIGSIPMVIMARPQIPANTMQDLVAEFKAAPKKYSYASNGTGSIMQLYTEMFKREAGIDLLHVPYRGGPEASRALLAGEVDLQIQIANANTIGYLNSGRAKAYAIGSATRIKALPNVPTTAEVGLPQLQMDVWYGLFAPAGVPKETLNRINSDLTAVLNMEDIKSRLADLGMFTKPESVGDFSNYFKSEYRRWAKLIEETGIQGN